MNKKLPGILAAALVLLLFATNLRANDIVVSNIILTGENTTDDYVMVQFNLSWENSWRTSSAPNNWDAAWVFVKYRVGSGEWQHAYLNNAGHTAPAGSTIKTGLLDPGSTFNATTNPALGVFIYRSADGTGTFSISDAQLRWNYGANGVPDNATMDVQVFAIEMVYVPLGAFSVGSGGTESGSFTNGSWTSGATIPLSISSENALAIGQASGNLWGTSSSGTNTIGGAGTLAASFPKGYAAFFCQKYEITQQQYVDFLNTLTRAQQNSRTETSLAAGTTSVTNRYVMSNSSTLQKRNGMRCNATIHTSDPITFYCDLDGDGTGGEINDGQWIACNWLSWMDGASYSDWAGLRPMTELEYEKACRGTATPAANEYAWGNITVTAANNITNPGAANETTTTSGANGVNGSQTNVQGPMRVGVFAKSATTRAQSGASYYGIMELSGNLWERPVTVGHATGRSFTGMHGNGALSANGHANETAWPGLTSGEVTSATGSGFRGGDWYNVASNMRASSRDLAAYTNPGRGDHGGHGFRSVRSPSLPVLTTTAATSITATTATSGGNVTSEGDYPITARGVCWSTSTGPTIALATKTTDGSGTGVFTSNLTGLTSNTTYYVRAYATSSAGTSYGNELSFKTLLVIGDSYQGGKVAYILQPGDPGYDATIQKGLIAALADQSTGIAWITGGSTQTTSNGNTLTAYGTGQANTNFMKAQTGYTGGAAKVCDDYTNVETGTGVYSDWYLPSKDELSKLYINQVAVGGFTSNWYWSSSESSSIYGWLHYFSFGTQGSTSKYSPNRVRAVRAFPTLPTVTTTAATSITATTATSGGNVTNAGDYPITARGVCWSTSTGPTIALTTKTTDGSGTGVFTSNLTGLTSYTTYYVRAYATSSAGTNYGNELSFKTLLAIGSSYQGGKVAYILQPGDPGYSATVKHGLIAALADQSTGIAWITGGSTVSTSNGNTLTAYGTGQANTNFMKAQTGYTGGAAKVCDDYTNVETGTGVYSDWYLPSKGELDKLFINRVAIGGFGWGYYWSSSEESGTTNYAWTQSFISGINYGNYKGTTNEVRAVRAF